MLRPARRSAVFPVIALAVVALGGCANDSVAPSQTRAPTVAPSTAIAASDGGYIVGFNGQGIPSDFGATVASLGGTVAYSHDGAGIATVTGLSDAAAAQLAATRGVAEIQPDADVSVPTVASTEATVTDPTGSSQANPAIAQLVSWQWNMRLIHADNAWAAGKLGSPGVTVAILDTGIDYDNPDLTGLVDLSRSTSFIPADDAITTTFFPTRNKISDYNGHGTNVAAQVSSKAAVFAGVSSKTTLIGVKVLGRTGSGSFSAILNGILWAADHGADVANLSIQGAFTKAKNGQFLGLLNRVTAYAKQKGLLLVVAAGNSSIDLDHDGNGFQTFCSDTHVVCVSSVGLLTFTGNGDVPAFYTNFGRSAIDVAAPGGNANAAAGFPLSPWPWGSDFASWVWSFCSKTRLAGLTAGGVPILGGCQAGNRLLGFIGTSQATPHVAGLAALLVDATGRGQPAQIKHLIEQSADDLGQPGTDPWFGAGRINVKKALGL
jgi:subtilisin family serine protease